MLYNEVWQITMAFSGPAVCEPIISSHLELVKRELLKWVFILLQLRFAVKWKLHEFMKNVFWCISNIKANYDDKLTVLRKKALFMIHYTSRTSQGDVL